MRNPKSVTDLKQVIDNKNARVRLLCKPKPTQLYCYWVHFVMRNIKLDAPLAEKLRQSLALLERRRSRCRASGMNIAKLSVLVVKEVVSHEWMRLSLHAGLNWRMGDLTLYLIAKPWKWQGRIDKWVDIQEMRWCGLMEGSQGLATLDYGCRHVWVRRCWYGHVGNKRPGQAWGVRK